MKIEDIHSITDGAEKKVKVKVLFACYPYDDPTIIVGVTTTDEGLEKLRKQFVEKNPEFEGVTFETGSDRSELTYDIEEHELDGDYLE